MTDMSFGKIFGKPIRQFKRCYFEEHLQSLINSHPINSSLVLTLNNLVFLPSTIKYEADTADDGFKNVQAVPGHNFQPP